MVRQTIAEGAEVGDVVATGRRELADVTGLEPEVVVRVGVAAAGVDRGQIIDPPAHRRRQRDQVRPPRRGGIPVVVADQDHVLIAAVRRLDRIEQAGDVLDLHLALARGAEDGVPVDEGEVGAGGDLANPHDLRLALVAVAHIVPDVLVEQLHAIGPEEDGVAFLVAAAADRRRHAVVPVDAADRAQRCVDAGRRFRVHHFLRKHQVDAVRRAAAGAVLLPELIGVAVPVGLTAPAGVQGVPRQHPQVGPGRGLSAERGQRQRQRNCCPLLHVCLGTRSRGAQCIGRCPRVGFRPMAVSGLRDVPLGRPSATNRLIQRCRGQAGG